MAGYNALFPGAARDITMQLVNARGITGLKADPDVFYAKLSPWANQNGSGPPRTLPDTATPQQVLQFISAFTAEVKKVAILAAK